MQRAEDEVDAAAEDVAGEDQARQRDGHWHPRVQQQPRRHLPR